MLIILMSGMMGSAIIFMQVPQYIAGVMAGGLSNPEIIIAMIPLGLLVAGLFVESTIPASLRTPILRADCPECRR